MSQVAGVSFTITIPPYTGTKMSLLDNISRQTATRNYSPSLHDDLSH